MYGLLCFLYEGKLILHNIPKMFLKQELDVVIRVWSSYYMDMENNC